jgi:16S rRNA (guanine527-N7)-methyltransferase
VAATPDPLDRLDEAGRAAMAQVVELLRSHDAPTTVRGSRQAWRVHVADSLSGLEFEDLAKASRIADVGAGAGFPGLALAAALPEAEVVLVESVGRKCEFMRSAVERARLRNVRVVCERAEEWAGEGGREICDAVTARAVGRLSTLAELASPLLREGGVLVAWKGKRDSEEEAELRSAHGHVGMELEEVRWVGPYAGSENRHLYLVRKVGQTPESLPRRPGMAKKRPFGA